ncbi:hypothetical protein [Mesorhizobium sp. ZC-5]|uniref:hypothetical protein n=1 Tax=Mesorhizobium sp. ZC-5 TaxID=2986066 RepID=UPI0021E8377B|nr:hypothetical protein [Mesorhizobium sp. ZC-5]MCV3239668.1 hypothetical protein [Mesorhizobium sp. ZC-5]
MADLMEELEKALLAAPSPAVALDVVNSFLLAAGIDMKARLPLLELQAALADISEGRTNPILEKAAFESGTSSRPIFEQQHMPLVAALVTLAKEEGMALGEAARYVASRFNQDTQKLLNYRKNLLSRKISAQEFETYVHWRLEFRAQPVKKLIARLAPLATKKE